ncbi:MAG: WD40 repeat domain-containing protein, partial [Planctomycetota bacterium]
AALLPEDEYSGHDLYVSDVAFVAAAGERGGSQLLTGSGDGTLREVDRETGVERRIQLPAGLAVASFAAGEPGQPTLVITFDREAWVSEARLLRGGKMGEPIFRHDGRIVGGALLRGGAAAVGTEDGVLALLDTETGKATARFETPWEIGALARVPGEGAEPDRILLGLGDGQARVIDPSDGGTVVTLAGHDQEVWAVAVDALGRHALTGSGDGTVRLWDLQTGAELRGTDAWWQAALPIAPRACGTRSQGRSCLA